MLLIFLMAENSERGNAISAPVTALHFISGSILISGEGSALKIYSTELNSCILSKKIFQKSRVHKFKVISKDYEGSTTFLAIGGKSIRIFTISEHQKILRVDLKSYEKEFGSWIWDATRVVSDKHESLRENKAITLITSQNTALKWNFDTDEVLVTTSCREQCILYSACFWGATLDELMVAVGTVFNEVLVWKPNLIKSSHSPNNVENVKKRLKGHEGVIFSVLFMSSGERLLSVSDDRSIRQWDVQKEECLQILYGHKARVWDATYLRDYIVSIGEDATCLVWDKNSSILKKFKGHRGKSIWSLATEEDTMMIATGGGDSSIRIWSTETTFSTKVHSHPMSLPSSLDSQDFPRNICIFSTNELLVLTNNGILLVYNFKYGEEDQWEVIFQDIEFSRYASMSIDKRNRLAAFGSLNGKVLIISIDDRRSAEKHMFDGKIFSVFILERNSECSGKENYIVASGPNGVVGLWKLVLDKERFQMLEKGVFKLPYSRQRWLVASIFVNKRRLDSQKKLEMNLIVGDRRGSIHVFNVPREDAMCSQSAEPSQMLLSMHGKNGITQICCFNDWIFSTGRDGSFRKYKIKQDGTMIALDRKKVCKGMDWIEGLMVQNKDILVYGFYMQSHFAIWSTNRNEIILKIQCGGGYRSWDFLLPSCEEKSTFVYLKGPEILLCEIPSMYNQKIMKEALHGRELTCLCIIDQIKNNHEDVILFATGSEDTLVNLVRYDYSNNEMVVIHRLEGHIGSVKSVASIQEEASKANSMLENEAGKESLADNAFANQSFLLFSCGSRTSLKCNRVFRHSNGHVSSSLLAEIGTPINSLKKKSRDSYDDLRFLSLEVIPLKDNSQSLLYCLAVACSDGYVRLYGFSSANRTFRLLMETNFHSRCVQVLFHFVCSFESRDYHFLLSGATDGRIALWDINACLEKFMCAKTDDSAVSGERKAPEARNRKSDHDDDDDDIDDTDGDGVDDTDGDGVDDTDGDWVNLKHRTERVFCLSDVLHASIPICGESREPVNVFEAHQSGVHCIHVTTNPLDSSILLASGGDDNSIFTSNFTLTRNVDQISCNISWKDKNIYAHHSTITGVQLINSHMMISCSIDQRLKVWQIDDKQPSVAKGTIWTNNLTEFLDIADASSLTCWVKDGAINAAICGVGLEIKRIEKNTDRV